MAWGPGVILAAVALLLPGAAAGQATAPTPTPKQQGAEVVVEGKRAPDAKDVRAQVRKIAPPESYETPLARFHDPLCLASTGLPRAVAELVLDRMVQDAEEARIDMAGEKCTPNVVLLFVDDGKTELTRLAKRGHRLVTGLPFEEYRDLMKQSGPVWLWSVKEVRSRDGDALQYDANGGPPTLKVASASRISAPIRRDIVASVLMIDVAAVQGKSPIQVADYAAMRTFGLARPTVEPRMDTILTLFDAAAPPAELTTFDRGYLRGLYTGQANAFSSTQRATIARSIATAADKQP